MTLPKRLAFACLVGCLSVGASHPAEPTTSSETLVVQSDPAGASVYVDGHFIGRTPLSVGKLATGDHRVRLVKDGYLENGRIVSMSARQSVALRVTLTPHGSAEPDGQVVSTGSGGGGGSKRWLWIGIAAGGAAAAAVALKDRNKPPTAGTVTVTPNEVGLAAATSFSFSAPGASDPNGDPLTYQWDFGDSSSASGAQVTHTFTSAGTRTVTLTVNDGKASATATASVTVRDLTGTWSGLVSSSSITMNLTQSNTSVTGTYTATFVCGASNGSSGPVSATVSATKAIAFTLMNPPCTNLVMQGTADANVNAASGSIVSGFTGTTQTFSLTRR